MEMKIEIKQKVVKEIIDKDFIEKILLPEMEYGVYNKDGGLDKLKEEEIISKKIIIFNSKLRGIGVGLKTNSEEKDTYLSLKFPALEEDIELFYKLIILICKEIQEEEFYQDNMIYKLKDIDNLLLKTKKYNLDFYVNKFLKGDNFLIRGAIYPINIEKQKIEVFKNLNPQNSLREFTKYLNNKQQLDYYYLSPIFHQTEAGKLFGIYVVYEDVPLIFPEYPNIKSKENMVDDWLVSLVKKEVINGKEEYYTIGEMAFDDFKYYLNFDYLPKFDDGHYLIANINGEFIDDLIATGYVEMRDEN